MLRITPRMESPPKLGTKEYDYWQVQNILNGQEEYWDLLYKSSYAVVSRCATRADYQNLFAYGEYRDIVDEAFALCYADLARYEGRSRFAYWVGGYARNITRNRCDRERTRQRNLGTLKTAAKQHMTNSDPMRILIRRETYRCLWRAFYELDVKDREIVALRVFREMKFREIGEEVRLSRKEVLLRYGRAVVELREHYLRYDRGDDLHHAMQK